MGAIKSDGMSGFTQAATTDLSDVSSGIWTPTDQSGAGLVFSAAAGNYRSLGMLTYVWGFVTYPVTADTSSAKISLPFASVAVGSGKPTVNLVSHATTTPVVGFIDSGNSYFSVNAQGGGAAVTNATLSGDTTYFAGVFVTS